MTNTEWLRASMKAVKVCLRCYPRTCLENSGKPPDTSARTADLGTTIRTPALLSVAIQALLDKTN